MGRRGEHILVAYDGRYVMGCVLVNCALESGERDMSKGGEEKGGKIEFETTEKKSRGEPFNFMNSLCTPLTKTSHYPPKSIHKHITGYHISHITRRNPFPPQKNSYTHNGVSHLTSPLAESIPTP